MTTRAAVGLADLSASAQSSSLDAALLRLQQQHQHPQHQQQQTTTQQEHPNYSAIIDNPGTTTIITSGGHSPISRIPSRKHRTPRELAKKLFEQSIFSSATNTLNTTTTTATTTTTTATNTNTNTSSNSTTTTTDTIFPSPSPSLSSSSTSQTARKKRNRFSMPMPNPNHSSTVESRVMGRGNSGIPSHAAHTTRTQDSPPPRISTATAQSCRQQQRQRASTVGSPLQLTHSNSWEKPQASTSGGALSMTIHLAEPTLFLQGFEQGVQSDRSPTMLRGSFILKVSKPAKIKAVSLTFKGKARTEWPEGIPPKKSEYFEEKELMQHTWPFFNAQFPTAEIGHCADSFTPRRRTGLTVDDSSHAARSIGSAISHLARSASPIGITPAAPSTVTDNHRISLGTLPMAQSRSFGKGESFSGQSIAQRGYRIFQPGDYVYNFELPLEGFMPETINADLGTVKYELDGSIERPGAFRPNLMGKKEVVLIRVPSEGNTEASEPIAISRTWEDQLHYDIVISGKSFPLGSTIPIAFKLTPLAKVRCHRIKIFITENIEYSCKNKKVHRLDSTKKIQLFEKRADLPASSTFQGSSLRIISGGGYSQEELAGGGETPDRAGTAASDNLLGDLHGNFNVGPTEMEFNVKLPGCTAKEKDRIHFDTTYQNIQVHHWIKIVMRLSKQDPNDPSKRRHFEISIDSPFHILSCLATNANTTLPAYNPSNSPLEPTRSTACQCPPLHRRNSPSAKDMGVTLRSGPPGETTSAPENNSNSYTVNTYTGPHQRPMHLIRAPSIGPPPFDADSTPPLVTPPPKYESVVGEHGLADYFSRLADAMHPDEDSDDDDLTPGRSPTDSHRRLMLPLTPGGRVARSMDERRTWEPIVQV